MAYCVCSTPFFIETNKWQGSAGPCFDFPGNRLPLAAGAARSANPQYQNLSAVAAEESLRRLPRIGNALVLGVGTAPAVAVGTPGALAFGVPDGEQAVCSCPASGCGGRSHLVGEYSGYTYYHPVRTDCHPRRWRQYGPFLLPASRFPACGCAGW